MYVGLHVTYLLFLFNQNRNMSNFIERTARELNPWNRIPVGSDIFHNRPDRPWGPPSLLCNDYRVFSGGKAGGANHPPPSTDEAEEE
jgi:hypothetical protein